MLICPRLNRLNGPNKVIGDLLACLQQDRVLQPLHHDQFRIRQGFGDLLVEPRWAAAVELTRQHQRWRQGLQLRCIR